MKNMTLNKREYIDLNTIYKEELDSKTYKINKIILSPERVRSEILRSTLQGNGWLIKGLQPNFSYIRLIKKGEGVMMSDTPMERNSNISFIKKANGDVLIFGLGLGLIILPLLGQENIKSITVIEINKDLIDLVKPILKSYDTKGHLEIIHGDCFEYHKEIPKGKKWDCIYGDIWIDINGDNYNDMVTLTNIYKYKINRDNPNSFLDHWLKQEMKILFKENKSINIF